MKLPEHGVEVARLFAGAELMLNVARLLNSTAMAETMFAGVRVGGNEKVNAPIPGGLGRRQARAQALAQTENLKRKDVASVVEEVRTAVAQWPRFAEAAGLPAEITDSIQRSMRARTH